MFRLYKKVRLGYKQSLYKMYTKTFFKYKTMLKKKYVENDIPHNS